MKNLLAYLKNFLKNIRPGATSDGVATVKPPEIIISMEDGALKCLKGGVEALRLSSPMSDLLLQDYTRLNEWIIREVMNQAMLNGRQLKNKTLIVGIRYSSEYKVKCDTLPSGAGRTALVMEIQEGNWQPAGVQKN